MLPPGSDDHSHGSQPLGRSGSVARIVGAIINNIAATTINAYSLMMEFRWNAWNIDHIADHGVTPLEAEYVVRRPNRGYPRYEGDGKFLVRGQSAEGRYLQVIYVFDPLEIAYVIHARPLTPRERQNLRKKRRR